METKGLYIISVITDATLQNKAVKILRKNKSNLQVSVIGQGGTSKLKIDVTGFSSPKVLVQGVINDENKEKTLKELTSKLKIGKSGKGLIYCMRIQSIVGSTSYKFLSNDFGGKHEV